MSITFTAFYEDADKCEAAAKKRGWTADMENGSWHDFIECEAPSVRTSRAFANLESATTWLLAEIADTKSVHGQGTIISSEPVPRGERCRYCTCNGVRRLHEWTVSNEVDLDEAIEPECCNGEVAE